MISSVVDHASDVFWSRPSLFLILVVGLVRLCKNQAETQDPSLCREFVDDARLTLHDCRESKREVVSECW